MGVPRIGHCLSEHGHPPPDDFLHFDIVAVSHFVGGGRSEAYQCGSAYGRAETAQLEFGSDFEAHHAVPFDEVHGHLGDGASGNDDVGASVGDGFDDFFHFVLFQHVVALDIVGVFHEDSAFGFGAACFKAAAKHRHFGGGEIGDGC